MIHSKAVNMNILDRRRKKKRERPSMTWKAVLKEDFDGDWECIVRILQYKLERTRKCIVGNYTVMDAPQIGKEIAEVEGLLQRLLDDPYHEEAFADFHKKYGKPKMSIEDLPEEKLGKSPASRGSTIQFLYKGKPSTPEMDKEMRKLYNLEGKLQRADLKAALGIIEKRLFYWWD